ncbi:hypothetical protein [Mesorhizobium sp. CAU 1732]|uniref:hypothetical protein n=1 Tax=Mesorhizobium sp. CAU 1732 TaxID=3140358 RepID=UPI003261608E
MDWTAAIERNGQALRRVLAMLVALAGLGAAQDGRPTLPRHLHRAVLRLLRPVEAAARRLIVIAARGLVVTLSPARPRKPRPKPVAPLLRSLGIAVVMPSADRLSARPAAAPKPRAARAHVLPLLDPIRLPRTSRARRVPAHAAPRICVPGATARHRLPLPPSPDDVLDATRLGLRLDAIASVLDDLPKHARRLARWRARRDRRSADGRPCRLSPLKPGGPPGFSRPPARDVDEILADLHHFAIEALAPPDTS